MTDTQINVIRKRAEAATPEPMTRNLYEHGGGRMFADDGNGGRNLVIDAYNEADRDFYFSARADVLALIDEIDRLNEYHVGE